MQYDLADAVQHWTRAKRALPSRVHFEMQMRGASCTELVWRGTLNVAWLRAHGLKPWHVASRVREQCSCACDSTYVYASKKVGGIGGMPWAGDALAGDSVVLNTIPPLLQEGNVSEPPLVAARLGIEAAGAVLRQELGEYMAGVDVRHLHLLSDAMTQTGVVLGATRAGMRRADAVSVLGRACFETGPQILAAAADTRASDPLYAASSRLAMGLVPRVGCHAIDIVEARGPDKLVRPRSFMDTQPAKRQRFDDFMTI